MNRAERRLQQKQKMPPVQTGYQNKHVNWMYPQIFVQPLEDFLDQIERGEVFTNEKGVALMDLPNERVEQMAAKGEHPREAIPNIYVKLETYFQITSYCFSDDDLERVAEEILSFKRKIINPINLGSPIQKSALKEARETCANIKAAMRKAPQEKVVRVTDEIMKVIESNTTGKVTQEELRAWLFKWAKGK